MIDTMSRAQILDIVREERSRVPSAGIEMTTTARQLLLDLIV